MKVVQLKSESIKELRIKRKSLMQGMIEGQEGSLLVLKTAYAGKNRKHHLLSYAIFTIFFELWDRFMLESWSYTFDEEGLIFYIKLEESADKIKDILVHYEDYHPLGFAIDSDVFDKDTHVSREDINVASRVDKFTQTSLDSLLESEIDDDEYERKFFKEIENYMLKGDKQTILSNILMYSYVSAYTKSIGFGMYGPNYRGSNEHMNFEKFIHLVRTYRDETLNIFNYNSKDPESILAFQEMVNQKIKISVLNQESYFYTVFMTSTVLFAFINSRGYADITKQIKKIAVEIEGFTEFENERERYDIAFTGYREAFNHYVPFYQKNRSVISTLLFIMSRYDDYSIVTYNGEKNLMKAQFLAKNLIFKEDKWDELNKFCTSSYLYPHDATTLLVVTCMLDVLQRNYLKIKILFDTNH
ncbi:citrate lyase holo-[acyl-carrier protein] synthase [Erysipelothrix urinaevulpis]|uniref:citrate lyase holo-[acyl-carrier protein] synthase n=1 Tax=Erysipelothrix urinaevulpis TaxID=2683717 RepID=UPI001356FAF8|nr:citrate lyase holo-[acyl-carrier protein] synthase [Erysipelothrix urinaevulpis]